MPYSTWVITSMNMRQENTVTQPLVVLIFLHTKLYRYEITEHVTHSTDLIVDCVMLVRRIRSLPFGTIMSLLIMFTRPEHKIISPIRKEILNSEKLLQNKRTMNGYPSAKAKSFIVHSRMAILLS